MKNNSREPAQTAGNAPEPWAVETMRMINELTPNVVGKAFDPDWFLLRQRLEEAERKLAASSQEAATPKCPGGDLCDGDLPGEWHEKSCPCYRDEVDGVMMRDWEARKPAMQAEFDEWKSASRVAEPAPSPATTRQWATFYRCGKNMGNDLLVIPCDLEKDHDGPCERNVWPVSAEPNATPKWERQESCPECDGDGCNFCGEGKAEQTVAYWKMRAEAAELKVLTFNEEIMKLRIDAPSPATKEEKEAMDEHVCKPSCHNPCLLDDRKQPGDDYRLDQSADGLLKRIEDYRTGYSCGYADGKNGGRMRDKDAAANFFGISGVPDVSEHAASPSPATKETPHTTTEDWVPCPVCGESGMSRETDIEGNVIISCVNHACASNGGSNTSGLSLQRELDSAHRLWEKEHDELVILREKVRRYDAGFDAGAKSVVAAPQPQNVFTPQEVESLNGYQASGFMHPFTCASGNRCDDTHAGGGSLLATVHGWICPFCDYRQDWAHDFMKNGDWKKSFAVQRKALAGAAALPSAPEPTTRFKDYYGDRWVPTIQRAIKFMSDCELTEFTREKTLNCMTAFALEMAVASPPVPSKEPK